MANRQQHGEDFWRDHIRSWEAGKVSQVEYCAANKLSIQTFCRWRGLFKRTLAAGRGRKATARLVPVSLSASDGYSGEDSSAGHPEIRIRFEGAPWVVHVQPGTDPGALAVVLNAVARASQ